MHACMYLCILVICMYHTECISVCLYASKHFMLMLLEQTELLETGRFLYRSESLGLCSA